MSIDPILALCATVLAFSALSAWLVLRPFERYRRELRKAQRQAAE